MFDRVLNTSMLFILLVLNKSFHGGSGLVSQKNIYLFEVYNINTRKRCEIGTKFTIKTPEQRHSGVFIVKFRLTLLFSVFIVNLEQVHVCLVINRSS